MAQFSWTDDLYTGSTLIDGDHRKLIGLVNALFETMESVQGNARMSSAMNDLIAYTEEHFGREEKEMERIQTSPYSRTGPNTPNSCGSWSS